jgi:hypothetical protein
MRVVRDGGQKGHKYKVHINTRSLDTSHQGRVEGRIYNMAEIGWVATENRRVTELWGGAGKLWGGQGNYAEGQASGSQKGLGGRIPREVLIG